MANFEQFATAKNPEFWAREGGAAGKVALGRVTDGASILGNNRRARQTVSRRSDPATHNQDDEVRRFHGLSAN